MAKDLVADIKDRLSVEDVVGSYIELRRAGANFKALSPFQAEKTPSLIVTPHKQIWKDFSSGRGGDQFAFVMEMEGVDFKGALEILATKAGLDLADYRQGPGSRNDNSQKQALLDLCQAAQAFYRLSLTKSRLAANYIRERGFNNQVINDFGLGYAPGRGAALTNHFRQMGVDLELAKRAGLVKPKDDQTWADIFWERLMLPLMDPQGRIIGFVGRVLKANSKAPKYINSPQTPIYNKSQHVFGLFQAKTAIRQTGRVVLVEGNLDVVASHQAGVKLAVAAGGTAITELHLKQLGRLTNDVRLALDGDRAGVAAMRRVIDLAQELGLKLAVIPLPAGQDPDDLVRKDPKNWSDLIARPTYALDWLYDQCKAEVDLKTAPGKRDFTDAFLKVVVNITDPVEKRHYLEKLAKEGFELSALEAKLGQLQPQTKTESGSQPVTGPRLPVQPAVFERQISLLLGFLLKHPSLRFQLLTSKTKPERQVVDHLKGKHAGLLDLLANSDQEVSAKNLPDNLQSEVKSVKLAEAVLSKEIGDRDAKFIENEPTTKHQHIFGDLIGDLSRQLTSRSYQAQLRKFKP